jgi:hypothetical protein
MPYRYARNDTAGKSRVSHKSREDTKEAYLYFRDFILCASV